MDRSPFDQKLKWMNLLRSKDKNFIPITIESGILEGVMQSTQLINKYRIVSIALLILPISGLSIDIYVPSLPAVSNYFGVDKAAVQLTITTYMIGLGLMQLFAGGISDSYGRQKPMFYSLGIYILSTLFIPFAHNINQLLALRFIQGATVGLTVVPMRSVFSDLFEGRELQKMMIYSTMVWSIGPIIAPAIGGYIQHYIGWQANFYLLALYSFSIFVAAWFYLPETSQHRHPFKINAILKRYIEISLDWQFAVGVLINGLLYSFIILFSIVGPFLIQSVLGYSAIYYGHISLLLGFAWFLGTMTNRFLIDIHIMTKTLFGLIFMLIIALIMLYVAILFPLKPMNVVLPVSIIFWTGGIIFPNYFAKNMALFPKVTGSANALFGSFIFIIAGISSAVGTLLKSSTDLPLICAYIIIIILCLILHTFERVIKQL